MALRAEFPEEGELIVGTVTSIRNFGAFVTLDEYNNREAFIHLSEVATGWVKYIRDHIREGQKIVARVLRIDTAKNQIDLSLKRINDHQRREKIQGWKNEQKAIRLLGLIAAELKIEPDATHSLFAESLIERYGSLYEAFEIASADPKAFQKDGGKLPWVAAFLKIASENLQPPHVTIKGTLEISDSAPDGLDHVRAALAEAEAVDPETVTVHYVGAPRYRVQVEGTQYKHAEETMKKATEAAIAKIRAAGGQGELREAMTESILRRCRACGQYGLHAACLACGQPTVTPHPARFSPQDRWAKYRRALYEDVARSSAVAEGAVAPGTR